MTPSTIHWILWIPFILTLLICGIVFCLHGYKKGLWRALISLGTTIVATAVSILLAKAAAFGLSAPLCNLVKDALGADVSMGIGDGLLTGAVETVTALVAFPLFLCITVVVGKNITKSIKREALATDDMRMRLGGIGVRALDAVTLTVLLLLPLYGTIGIVAPVAERYMSLMQATTDSPEDAEDDDLYAMIGELAQHPTVQLSKLPPAEAVYQSLSNVTVGGERIHLPETSNAASEVLKRLKIIIEKPSAEYGQEEADFLGYLRDDVIDEPWFYGLCVGTFKEMGTVMAQSALPDETDMDDAIALLDSPDISREEFVDTAEAGLTFTEFLLENQYFTMVNEGNDADMQAFVQSDAFCSALGEVLNATDTTVRMKAYLLADVDVLPDGVSREQITDPAAQQQEARALIGGVAENTTETSSNAPAVSAK